MTKMPRATGKKVVSSNTETANEGINVKLIILLIALLYASGITIIIKRKRL